MLKPQDIVLAVKLLCKAKDDWSQGSLAQELVISASEVNAGLKRLARARLVEPHSDGRRCVVIRSALREFLLHGIKYVFPAVKGAPAVGMATAYAASAYVASFNPQSLLPVWPDKSGKTRGFSFQPLYPTVSLAAKNDPDLYEWLALIDCLRDRDNEQLDVAEVLLREKMAGKKNKKIQTVAVSVEESDQQLDLLSL
jgi:hypothetical protein